MKWQNHDTNVVFRMGKHSNSKVSSPTKWKLEEKVALQLMECLTSTVSFDIFKDNYFISFRLLSQVAVFPAGAFNKNRLCKCTIIEDKKLQKKECCHFEQHISTKKAV